MSGEHASFRDRLAANAAEVGLGPDQFDPLPDHRAAEVASSIEVRFGDSVQMLWWGTDSPCDSPSASRHFEDDRGWSWIDRIAPQADDAAWFIAENWGGGSPRCFVFEATPTAVRAVLGNSRGFEYLLASKRLDWLIAENHHSVVIVVGQAVVDRLRQLDA